MNTRTAPAPSGTSTSGDWLWARVRSRETGIFLAFALVVIATTVRNPSFLFSGDGWRDLLLTPAIVAVVAIGQAVVIITRNVDLSVGSIVGLTAYLVGTLFVAMPGFPVAVMFVVGVTFGALLGLINGALVAFGKVPAMVITLGTLYAYRGINVAWTGSNRINASDLPEPFLALGTQQIFTIPVLTIIALVILALVGWYMANTRGGREFYAIGSDPAAAELYGLATTKRVLMAFVASGAASGLAGVLFAARYGTINSQVGAASNCRDRRCGDRRRRHRRRQRHSARCRLRRLSVAHHQPCPPRAGHSRLLAARGGRGADHRRHHSRPGARRPTSQTLQQERSAV